MKGRVLITGGLAALLLASTPAWADHTAEHKAEAAKEKADAPEQKAEAKKEAEAAPDIGLAERDNYKGLTLKLSKTEFIRFITWQQIWTRFTDPNPGTAIAGNPAEDSAFDIGLRRSRFLGFAQLNEFQVMTHFGVNNQSFNDFKPTFFMHDAWTQFSPIKKYLSIGFGLHYWHGISRLTNQSTLNLMTLDAPVVNWPTIELSDQFARFLGIWIKGQIPVGPGQFDYRFSLNRPFRHRNIDPNPTVVSDDNPDGLPRGVLGRRPNYNERSNTISLAGYLEYQFLDGESDALPYKVGTYIGNKKVFNLGAGFYYHPESMQSVELQGDLQVEENHDQLFIGVDAYLDMPVGDRDGGGAVSAYFVFYNYDFGPDYVRNVGLMNIADGPTRPNNNNNTDRQSFNGFGNGYPVMGTGQHFYAQVGYLIPPSALGGFEFMPYLAGQFSNMEGLDDPMMMGEAGLNWFLQGHHAKVSFALRSRPIFNVFSNGNFIPASQASAIGGPQDVEIREDGRAAEFIIQTHIFL